MAKFSFLAKTALRDSRKNIGRLFMFMSSIILGIAALVAINSFNHNLVKDIDQQAKSLLGSDLQFSANKDMEADLYANFDSIPGEKASQMELFNMAYVPKVDETQFVRIRALDGNYPFYGKIKTEPTTAADEFQQGKYALVDDGLMFEYELEVGDSIKIGEATFGIKGRLMTAFGSVSVGSSFAPTVYISRDYLEATQLVQPGSLIEYNWYIKLPDGMDSEEWDNANQKPFNDQNVRVTSIDDQKGQLDRAFSSLNSFLSLVALVSLILGCIGVASSVLIYVKSKIPSIAVFRCLGMQSGEALWIYFMQIFVLGFISVIIGAAIGSSIQMALPALLKDFLPYEVSLSVSWPSIIQGVIIGTVITSLFALAPLLSVRKISPLRTLRASFDEDVAQRDPMKGLVYGGILLSLFLFLYSLNGNVLNAAIFTFGLVVAFVVLYGVAILIMWLVRNFFPTRWNFTLRQGLSNLYRPNNQTRTLIVSIGLGTAILTTLIIIQGLILNNVSSMDAGNQPNLILYGIEKEQTEELKGITNKYDLPVIQDVPIVTMRLAGWKGKTKSEWLADTTRRTRRWAANREARVSYRDTLNDDELLISGELKKFANPGDSIYISLDQGYAEGLNVGLGDEVVWNVQGAMITTYVGSLREIEFRSMRSRFFILFPNGVLEKAPQFHVLITKTPNNETLAKYRREVVKAFPNVSVVDLGSILVTLNDILSKISYVIKFMALFSILTGLIVLISSLLLSKFQRIKESVLLRTIGASSGQILSINATEYAILGALSAATGILLALAASYLLASLELDLDFNIQWLPILLVFLGIIALTTIIGLFNSREVIQKSPLEVLRREV